MDTLTTATAAEAVGEVVIAALQTVWPTRAIRVVGVLAGDVDIAVEGDDGADWQIRVMHPWN